MTGLRLALCALLLPVVAAAQLPDTLFVPARVTPAVVKIGEHITVDFVLPAAAGDRFVAPPPMSTAGPIDVIVSEAREAGGDSVGWQLKIAAFALGDIDVSGIPFVLSNAQGERQVRLEPYRVSVVSSLPESLLADTTATSVADLPLRDIRGPLNPKVEWIWWRIALAVLLLAGLIAALVFLRRRLNRKERIVAALPQVSPEEEARTGFRRLAEEALAQRGHRKEHYARLSLILRGYIERRLELPAVESTTDEIRGSWDRGGVRHGLDSASLFALLDAADLVKFAKQDPGVQTAEQDLERARTWVEAAWSTVARRGVPTETRADHAEPAAAPTPQERA